MADEQQTEKVETTTTENVEKEVQQEQAKKEFIKNDKGHQIDIDKVVGERLKRQERLIAEELGVESLEQAKLVIEERRKLEEEKQLERGKFDDVIKKRTEEFNEKITKLESELKNERIDKQLISAASKYNAINPDQIRELMKHEVRLSAEGK